MSENSYSNVPHLPDDPEQQTPPPAFHMDEPPIAEEDTRPKAPAVVPEMLPPQGIPQAPAHLPIDAQTASLLADPDEWATGRIRAIEDGEPARGRALLLVVVMAGTVCLCMAMIGLASFAGYRDGLATNDARVTQTLATGIAEQYATGAADLQAGYAELAAARFEWIVETIQAPTQYALDSPVQLAVARTIAAYTPTSMPTLTPTASPSPTVTLTPPPSPTSPTTPTADPLQDPAYFYEQATTAMRVSRYEDALEWLDALIALDPTYQRAEVNDMLLRALTQQGRIYLLGANEDGQDRLSRGVYLIYRADDIGTVEPDWLLGQAIFVERYVNARNYVNGGNYGAALPVLEGLCTENCDWSYGGVSVRDLLCRAEPGHTRCN